MAKINEPWHRAHPMPGRAKADQRLDWHRDHAAHCGCRPIPRSVRDLLKQRDAAAPTGQPQP